MFFKETPIPADIQRVLDSAALLDITEFQFFQLAYSEWYGHALPEAQIEPYFAEYMLHETVPFWVRHLSSQVTQAQTERHGSKPGLSLVLQRAGQQSYWLILLLLYIAVTLSLSG